MLLTSDAVNLSLGPPNTTILTPFNDSAVISSRRLTGEGEPLAQHEKAVLDNQLNTYSYIAGNNAYNLYTQVHAPNKEITCIYKSDILQLE